MTSKAIENFLQPQIISCMTVYLDQTSGTGNRDTDSECIGQFSFSTLRHQYGRDSKVS